MNSPGRGDVFVGALHGFEQSVVIVSNDARNGTQRDVLAVPILRIVRASVASLDTVVSLGDAECVEGNVLLDYVIVVLKTELDAMEHVGTLGRDTMHALNHALSLSLGL
jgi:mRNA-degrading endonuclease toxin of MazEF toxin-antitoxin module